MNTYFIVRKIAATATTESFNMYICFSVDGEVMQTSNSFSASVFTGIGQAEFVFKNMKIANKKLYSIELISN